MPNQKDVTEIIAAIRETGEFKVGRSGSSKHYKVLRKTGGQVVDDDGPIIISSTPSEERFKEMTVKRLLKAGVLKKDPFKATPTKGSARSENGDRRQRHNPMHDPVMKEKIHAAKVKAIKAKSARMHERTAHLRSRLEPIVVKLGGWSQPPRGGPRTSGIAVSELAGVVYHWANIRGRAELPKTSIRSGAVIDEESLRAPAQTLKQPGKTLGEKWLPLFEVFIDELERNAGVPVDYNKAAARYWELYREWKGISNGATTPAAGPPVKLAVVPANDTPITEPKYVEVGPRHDPNPPSLALEAVFRMSQAADAGEHFHDIMAIGERIAKLELEKGQRWE